MFYECFVAVITTLLRGLRFDVPVFYKFCFSTNEKNLMEREKEDLRNYIENG